MTNLRTLILIASAGLTVAAAGVSAHRGRPFAGPMDMGPGLFEDEGGPGAPGKGPHGRHMHRGPGGFDREELRAKFDANGDGALDESERQQARAFMRQKMNEHREEMFRRLDANGDGQLTREEFNAARDRREEARAEHRARFMERFDTDKDGVLSDSERAAARDAMRARGEARRAELLKRFDANADGELTGEEREQARASVRQEMIERRAAHRIDTNHDGVVDADEVKSAVERVTAGDASADLNHDGKVDSSDAKMAVDLTGKPVPRPE